MNSCAHFLTKHCRLVSLGLAVWFSANVVTGRETARQQTLLSGADWQFTGTGAAAALREMGANEFAAMSVAARAHMQRNFTMRRINDQMRNFYVEAVIQHGLKK
jgi:hypothetical protein